MEYLFILKKIISAFIMPLSFGLLLLLFGTIYLYIGKIKLSKILISISFIVLFCISYVPFSNFLIEPLETKYKKLQIIPKDVKYILLLGGDFENRAWEALRLYHKIEDAKIITSGYAGRSFVSEAEKAAKLLKDVGVKEDDILIHSSPKDTKEEAIKIKEILKNKKFILVTSSYHMPRAIELFKKEGLNPIPAPTDFKIKVSDEYLSSPKGNNISKSQQAWHEYLGLIWSKLRRQI
jgi:uncharacterized SAM-binding protein YcdF (DUF218 family)